MHRNLIIGFTALAILATRQALADDVTLSNGDHLTGKIGTIVGGKMQFSSPALGDITIDMANVKSFATDEPAKVRVKKDGTLEGKITSGDAAKIALEDKGEISMDTIKQINPPAQKWTGSVLVTGDLARGNTNQMSLGVAGNAILRRDDEHNDDRLTLTGSYAYGRTGRGDNIVTSSDNWHLLTKYDKFWTEKLYGYAVIGADHDRVAGLNYRLAPGVGVGYQWIESPKENFNTEAGVSYVWEDYHPGADNDYVSLRLAYHYDRKLLENLTLFNNVQWLPAFKDPGDYNLFADVGLRTTWSKALFSEFKVLYARDSRPAEGREKDDVKFILGVGWTF